MNNWRTQAKKGVDAFGILGDGPPIPDTPRSGTRGPTIAVRRLQLVQPGMSPSQTRAQEQHRLRLHHVAHGSWAVGLGWMLWSAFGISMILQEKGGGSWLVWFAVGIPGWLCQSRNQIIVSSRELLIRRGLSGDHDRCISTADISDIWARQGFWGRLLDCGRIGLRLNSGEVVWGPLTNDPITTKHAIVAAVTGSQPPGIPPHLQEPLRGL